MIKTYEHINKLDSSLNFAIERMEDIYQKRNGKSDMPHRHDFYTILVIKEGAGKHFIDFNEYAVTDGQVCFISPGQVHQLVESQMPVGWVIRFSSQFLANNNIDHYFIDEINLFKTYGDTPPLQLAEEDLERLMSIGTDITNYLNSNTKYRMDAVAALIKLLLINCSDLCTLDSSNTQQIQTGVTLLKKYKKLVEEHFWEWHMVAQYASSLHVTSDYLNRTIKLLVGKTAKEYLQSRIIVAAKRALKYTEVTNKEIGFDLGFSEPANFSNFFKKCTGYSPTEFRNLP